MMNNVLVEGGSSSECSSGCESGWTLYLEHSNSKFSVSKKCHNNNNNNNKQQKIACFDNNDDVVQDQRNSCSFDDEDEDEDLSMVSDASSGPPHFDHDVDDVDVDVDEVQVFCYSGKKRQSMRFTTTTPYYKSDDFTLDDTASSPNFIPKNYNGGENQVCSLKRVIDYSSQGFSGTHINQGRSKNFQEHYGFIQPQLSTKQF